MQTYAFTKMHGCGNDYVYIDQFHPPYVKDPLSLSVVISDRHTAIGADGLILVCPPEDPANDGRMRMFNADGSEGKMCGNGIRCVGKFLYDHGYVQKPVIRIETAAGLRTLRLHVHGNTCTGASVDMGKASFLPHAIPVNAPDTQHISVEVNGEHLTLTAVSMGNPHAVLFSQTAPSDLPIEEIARKITALPANGDQLLFPEGVNVEFVRVIAPDCIEMRVYERGSGETMACGTGACAVVCAAIENGLCHPNVPVTVRLRGGDVQVTVDEDWQVTLTGPAAVSFTGEYTTEVGIC